MPEPSASRSSTRPDTASGAAFFQVGTEKLIELSLLTFGLYGFWWTWQQWQSLKARGEAVNPWVRTLLSVIWQYDLYRRIATRTRTEDMACRWHALRLHGLFVGFTLVPLWLLATDHPWGLLINLMTLLPNVLVNQSINAINEKYLPFYEQNTELSGRNWAAVVAGVVAWLTLLTLALTSDL
ncbi:hypothetical protein ACQUQU_05950 [Thalassolituus sp. LLYu03]|uniref:hypothetical protein n=1 Tax=Thalassolituus sp. LLYu03 TaxID=3421656 RepID=UPI003D2D9200